MFRAGSFWVMWHSPWCHQRKQSKVPSKKFKSTQNLTESKDCVMSASGEVTAINISATAINVLKKKPKYPKTMTPWRKMPIKPCKVHSSLSNLFLYSFLKGREMNDYLLYLQRQKKKCDFQNSSLSCLHICLHDLSHVTAFAWGVGDSGSKREFSFNLED